jgi:hypothetical protein
MLTVETLPKICDAFSFLFERKIARIHMDVRIHIDARIHQKYLR